MDSFDDMVIANNSAIAPEHLTAAKEYKGGYGNDVVVAYQRDARYGGGVDANERDQVTHGQCYAVERGVHRTACTTPRGVEVDECEAFGGYDVIEVGCFHALIVYHSHIKIYTDKTRATKKDSLRCSCCRSMCR